MFRVQQNEPWKTCSQRLRASVKGEEIGARAYRLEGRVGEVRIAAEGDARVCLHSIVEEPDDEELVRGENDLLNKLTRHGVMLDHIKKRKANTWAVQSVEGPRPRQYRVEAKLR